MRKQLEKTELNEKTVKEILLNKKLARFGDSLLNFIYSFALTKRRGEPTGEKVSDKVLSIVAKNVGIRKFLPSRISKGEIANSIEALLGDAWLKNKVSIEELIVIIEKEVDDPVKAIEKLTKILLKKLSE
ncbi:MAG: ribonuclease III family protein [Candidatus Bathyarchaeia archaeon]|nr:hypothetical protein [Candidatus Bathyarchaeota archaeon]